jgi:hypothetical protein
MQQLSSNRGQRVQFWGWSAKSSALGPLTHARALWSAAQVPEILLPSNSSLSTFNRPEAQVAENFDYTCRFSLPSCMLKLAHRGGFATSAPLIYGLAKWGGPDGK